MVRQERNRTYTVEELGAMRLLTRTEVAALARVGMWRVNTWTRSGALPVVRLGPNLVRVRQQDLERFLQERRVPAPEPSP